MPTGSPTRCQCARSVPGWCARAGARSVPTFGRIGARTSTSPAYDETCRDRAPAGFHEDDLSTFEGGFKHQGFDAARLGPHKLAMWRDAFEEVRKSSSATPKVGFMKLRPIPGEHRYAVAVREDSDLWLTLWVRRSPKGEFFVMVPRGDRGWDPHMSYHLDGTMHSKSYGHKFGLPRKPQPLTGTFV